MERGSARRSSFKGRETAIVSLTKIGTVSKAIEFGAHFGESDFGAHTGFSDWKVGGVAGGGGGAGGEVKR